MMTSLNEKMEICDLLDFDVMNINVKRGVKWISNCFLF